MDRLEPTIYFVQRGSRRTSFVFYFVCFSIQSVIYPKTPGANGLGKSSNHSSGSPVMVFWRMWLKPGKILEVNSGFFPSLRAFSMAGKLTSGGAHKFSSHL